jgi:hypothetical protein
VATLPLRRSPNPPKPPKPPPSDDDDPTEDTSDDPTPVRTDREHYAALLKDQLNQLPDVFVVPDGPSTIAGVYVEVTLATSGRELDCAPDAPHGQGREAALRRNASVEDLRGRVPLSDVLAHVTTAGACSATPAAARRRSCATSPSSCSTSRAAPCRSTSRSPSWSMASPGHHGALRVVQRAQARRRTCSPRPKPGARCS